MTIVSFILHWKLWCLQLCYPKYGIHYFYTCCGRLDSTHQHEHYQRSIILPVLKLSHFKNSTSNSTACKIFWIRNIPNAPSEILHLCYIHHIWQQHHVNAQKHLSLETHSQTTFINITQPIFIPWGFFSKEDCWMLLYKSNPFLMSLPLDINI